jgi:hypothetical protein
MAGSRKSISVSLKTVLNGTMALARLAQLPLATASAERVLRVKKHIGPIQESYNERRSALLKELGTPVEGNPNQWSLGENMQRFSDELAKIAEEEVKIPLDITLEKADLGDAKISADDLDVLSFVFRDLD